MRSDGDINAITRGKASGVVGQKMWRPGEAVSVCSVKTPVHNLFMLLLSSPSTVCNAKTSFRACLLGAHDARGASPSPSPLPSPRPSPPPITPAAPATRQGALFAGGTRNRRSGSAVLLAKEEVAKEGRWADSGAAIGLEGGSWSEIGWMGVNRAG